MIFDAILSVFSVLGHEAIVEVVAHRRPESDLVKGDRLTFSVADCCGKCEFCLKDLNQKCTKLFKVRALISDRIAMDLFSMAIRN